MVFDYTSYQANIANPVYFPDYFLPHFNHLFIDINQYNNLQNQHNRTNFNYRNAFIALRKRTGNNYFNSVYPAQVSALNFSYGSYPPYKFLLPDVLSNDWAAIVDFRSNYKRDHALHQPLTAYIVHELLGGGIVAASFLIGNKRLLEACVDQILNDNYKTHYIKEYLIKLGVSPNDPLFTDNAQSRTFWNLLFYEAAMVAAIFHDTGYPYQYISGLNNNLNISSFSPNNMASDAEFVIKNFKDRLVLYPFNGYKHLSNDIPCNWHENLIRIVSKSLSKTHGFPGALGFLFLQDTVRKYPTPYSLPFHQFGIDWAALGIMMHDLGKIYRPTEGGLPENRQLRVEFDRDPISSIITLADTIEDFRRPTVNMAPNIDGSVFSYNYACTQTDVSFRNGILDIVYTYPDPVVRRVKNDILVNEEYNLFNPADGYLDLSCLGIHTVNMIAVP
jgi:hypothetical protein